MAVLIADWSGLVDLVDGNDGKRAGPTRIVHAGHGIDGLTDLCDGETMSWPPPNTSELWFRVASCPKNGDVPKSPFPTVAAVVSSAGTITL